jgi:Endonuclease/Exonuclease/phosphatase family
VRLATWNVALPVASSRRTAARRWLDEIAADVLVLTETHDGFVPGYPFSCSSAPGRDGRHLALHRWVTVWSKFRLDPLVTADPERTTAVRIFPVQGAPFLVYGTVLPWIGSEWRGHASRGGVAFCESLKVQLGDWKKLRAQFPEEELFVMGDFNQDLGHEHYYGSRITRTALKAALDEVGLVAVTSGAGDPIRRDSPPLAGIDHICMMRDSSWKPEPAIRWPNVAKPEKWLSDHFGVAVNFDLRNGP